MLANAFESNHTIEKAYLVNLLIRTRSTEAVETELLVRVALPAHRGHGLNGHDRDTIRQDGETVVLGLSIEDLEARNRDDTSLEAVLLLESGDSLDTDADFGTGGDESDVGFLVLDRNVTTLDTVLERRVLELRHVLTGESHDGGGVLGGESEVVGGAGLVAVGRTPDHHVGESTEVSEGLDRLVSRAVFTETDGVVGRDHEGADLRKRRQTAGTGGVGNEVEESTTGRDDGAVGGKTVHDSSHGVLTDTVAEVATRPVTKTSRRRLEVNSTLPDGVVGTSQIGGAGQQLGNDAVDGLENSLRQLAGSVGLVAGLVGRQSLLPALGELARETAGEILVEVRELLGVLLQKLVPLGLLRGTLSSVLAVHVIDLLGNDEALLRVEAEQLLDVLDVVSLEGVTVNTVSALELGAVADDGGQLDDGRLVLDLLGLLDGSLNALQVVVAVLDPLGVPAVGLEALHDILREGAVGVTVNGDVVVVVDHDEVAELEVTGGGGSLRGNTLHSAAITEEGICVVGGEVEARLVEDGTGVSLRNGETDGVGETLAERTSGDFDTGGVVSLRVTRRDAVELLRT